MCNRNKCTCWFDRFLKWEWGECCGRHDVRYVNKRLTRKQADVLLRRCVLRKTDCELLAWSMYAGVRTLGWYWYNKAQKDVK